MKKNGLDLKKELKKRMHEDSGYFISAYPKLFKKTILELIKPFRNKNIDKVMSPELMGMFYGPTIAYRINKPFIIILKSGRAPKELVISKQYKDYSKKTKSIDVGKISLKKGERILFVDDVFETGESAKAAISLIESLGGKVVGISVVYNRLDKKDEGFFKKYNFHYLVKMKKEKD